MTIANPTSGIHRFALLLAVGIVGLIAAGGLVKSLEAGLSVPDWPLSYGSLNPPRWWEIETVRAEHGHRLIAGTVALATVALAVWVGRRETRRWVRRVAYGAVAAVFAQALLGGITVLFFLPTPISVSHAALAQIFLCMVAFLALVTSSWWRRAPEGGRRPELRPLARLGTAVSAVVFLQIVLGAVVRHTGSGLAIPDFPLAFGRLLPPRWEPPIALHFAHRVGALVVSCAVVWLLVRALRSGPAARLPRALALAMTVLVAGQIGLGAAIVLTGRSVLPNTLHVATGAALLAAGMLLAVSAWRLAGAGAGATGVEHGTAGAAPRLSEVA